MNEPYGGKLIKKIIPAKEKDTILSDIDLTLNIEQELAKDAINICIGLYSPLEGFMNSDDFASVVEKRTLANGDPWTIPIYLAVSKEEADKMHIGSKILLVNEELGLKVLLVVEDKFTYDLGKYCENVYTTNDKDHPGPAEVLDLTGNVFIGGEIYLIEYANKIIPEYNFTPEETRKKFKEMGLETIVAFQTRNAPHLAHEHIQKVALEFVDGLFVNPIIGKKKAGDFQNEVILEVYKKVMADFYPPNSTVLGIFPTKMRYAGPREAVFHAIVRKNFGCTHFIVGRDHAGVGSYYDKFAAHKIFDEIGDIGMNIMKFSNSFYSPKLRMYTTQKVSPELKPEDKIEPSGTEVRQLIKQRNFDELSKFMRAEALEIIFSFEHPFVT